MIFYLKKGWAWDQSPAFFYLTLAALASTAPVPSIGSSRAIYRYCGDAWDV